MRILLVEDDETIREVFSMMLQTDPALPGIEVVTAGDGRSAIEQASRNRPDLVLLDLSLPDRDGFEVFAELRALPGAGELAVAAVTAHDLPELRRRATDAGFAAYVTKPIDFAGALVPLIRNLLDEQARQSKDQAA